MPLIFNLVSSWLRAQTLKLSSGTTRTTYTSGIPPQPFLEFRNLTKMSLKVTKYKTTGVKKVVN